jgi:glutamate formiminotransferase/formiminotetrahydrofolate cyclodeaminase
MRESCSKSTDMKKLVECVPNFSEGRDMEVMKRITDVIEAVDGVTLLDVDPGAATNRTVVTFVGEPGPVLDAAVAAGKAARENIDMASHSGGHPRFGSMDVCPLVPIAGLDMAETAELARELGRRLGEEAGLTVYLYENAASKPERVNLAVVRAGEYEALENRLKDPQWAPDFGPAEFQPRTGATAVSARDFLAAFNVNLNTTSTRRANAVAFDVREKGRMKREPHPVTGEIVRDADGKPIWAPGSLKCCKGIGWFIEEYGVCQVSMNLTNLSVTSVHQAFEETRRAAEARGVRVTGSELVGLVPLSTMLDAGKHFLRLQKRSLGVSDAELIKIAVRSMGLDELSPFVPAEKIVEYAIAAKEGDANLLVDRTLRGLANETASESPAPGGGSIAAAVGAFGAALATMVANLSAHKPGWDDRWEDFSVHAEAGKRAQEELLLLVDKDTDSFNAIMQAWRLPAKSDADKAAKQVAVQAAVRGAIEAPLRVMEVALASMDICEAMAKDGLKASASDAGVGALCARTAVLGAGLNVRINVGDLDDRATRDGYLRRAEEMEELARTREAVILELVIARNS